MTKGLRYRMRHGFSLLEMSVALVVVALVAGFGVTGGRNALEGSDRVTTQQRLATIQKALDGYARLNGYLPCPAHRDQKPSTLTFGMESRSGATCTADGDIKSVPTGTPTIYIGAVPVRSLGLPDAYAADSWSNKFLYAVSARHVGDPLSYATADGAILVLYGDRKANTSGNPALDYYYPLTTDRAGEDGPSAVYVVLSHGADGKGAYPLTTTTVPTLCGTARVNDDANCDDTNEQFFDTAFNDKDSGVSHFDDYIIWKSNALMRTPLVVQDNPTTENPLPGGNTACESDINDPAVAPNCDTDCSNSGFSASGATVTDCTYNAACTSGSHLRCSYQCSCSGQPPSSCAQASTTWGSGSCTGDVPILGDSKTAVIYNAAAGFTGSQTASCSNGVLSYSGATCTAIPSSSSTSSTSSSTGGRAGCSTGNCEEWCAPCRFGGTGTRFRSHLCEKFLISESPCQAACIYAGCGKWWRGGYGCSSCP